MPNVCIFVAAYEMEDSKEINDQETAFSSPIPFFNSLKKLIFGKEDLPVFQQVMLYVNFLIWIIFFVWHILSFYAISFRDIILAEKKVNVEILILNRGADLGYDPTLFLDNLLNFHRLSIVCWILVFVAIVLMWRKRKFFIYILFGALLLYYGCMFSLLGTTYYQEDTTLFDKISIAIFVLNCIFYFILLRNKDVSGEKFFGLEE